MFKWSLMNEEYTGKGVTFIPMKGLSTQVRHSPTPLTENKTQQISHPFQRCLCKLASLIGLTCPIMALYLRKLCKHYPNITQKSAPKNNVTRHLESSFLIGREPILKGSQLGAFCP